MSDSRRSFDLIRKASLVASVGLAVGALTQLGQATLPDGWSQMANAISPWLLVAFLVGSRMPRPTWAAIAGIGVLLFALVGYYGMVQIQLGYGGSTGSLVFWSLGAVVGGPVFGVGGFLWRNGTARQRAAALGLLVAVGIAEGIYNAVILSSPAVGAGFVVAGLLMPLVLGRARHDRIGAYVAAIPALVLAAFGYFVFISLNTVTAGL